MTNDNDNLYQNVQVTLTPLGNFFFGGQKRTEVENEKDYYVKSLFFPPQTTILGLLRMELLIQNNLFPLNTSNREEAARFIGESSFDPKETDQKFGAIQELSPVFIKDNEDRIFHMLPNDYGHPYSPQPEGKSFFNHPEATSKPFIPNFENYKAKDPHPVKLGSKESPSIPIELNDIFIPDEQSGIKKGKDGQSEEQGYYKQVFLRLKKGFAFSFFLKLKTSIDDKTVRFENNITFNGGERSAFRMEVRKCPDSTITVRELFDQTLPEWEGPKIVLTGDAFVEPNILNTCDFSVSDSVFFRNFRSYVKTTRNHWNLTAQKSEETPFLGDRYNLLSRGTVLYYGNDPETCLTHLTRLLDNPHFQKIGFNYYKTYPSQKEKGKE